MKSLFHFAYVATMLLLSVAESSGRIGESREQVIGRYGPLISDAGGLLVFQKSNYDVCIRIIDGTCQFLMIQPKAGEDGKRLPFHPETVRLLLEASTGPEKWSGEGGLYKTADGKITAALVSESCLLIQTEVYRIARNRKQSEAADNYRKEKLGIEGF